MELEHEDNMGRAFRQGLFGVLQLGAQEIQDVSVILLAIFCDELSSLVVLDIYEVSVPGFTPRYYTVIHGKQHSFGELLIPADIQKGPAKSIRTEFKPFRKISHLTFHMLLVCHEIDKFVVGERHS